MCSRDQLSTSTHEVGVQQDFRSQKLTHIFNSSLTPPIPHSHMPRQLRKHAKKLNTANTSINMTQMHEAIQPNLEEKKTSCCNLLPLFSRKKMIQCSMFPLCSLCCLCCPCTACCLCETRHKPGSTASSCYGRAEFGCSRLGDLGQ